MVVVGGNPRRWGEEGDYAVEEEEEEEEERERERVL